MEKKFIVEQMAQGRWFYHCNEINKKGEKLIIELVKVENCGCKNSLPNLWVKHGYIDRVLENYWSIQTYVTDKDGNQYGKYNPQHEKICKLNFDWVIEATENNKERLLKEVYGLFTA